MDRPRIAAWHQHGGASATATAATYDVISAYGVATYGIAATATRRGMAKKHVAATATAANGIIACCASRHALRASHHITRVATRVTNVRGVSR